MGPDKHEIDFIAGEPGKEPLLAIQVCMDLSAPDVVEREDRALRQVRERLGEQVEPLILTLSAPPTGIRTVAPVVRACDWAHSSAAALLSS